MASEHSTGKDRADSLDSHLTAYSAAAEVELAVEAQRRKTSMRGLAACSAAAAGAGLIPALNVDAAIVHNSNAGAGWTVKSGTTSFDFDAGGYDFKLTHDNGSTGAVWDVGLDGSVSTNGAGFAQRNAYGATIPTGFPNWNGSSGFLTSSSGNGNFGPGQNGYVAVRFVSSGTTVYGWIHIDSVAGGRSEYHVAGYAYETSGGTIKAGEKPVPEPSTIALALLASGAAGVMRSRRKKILKGRK